MRKIVKIVIGKNAMMIHDDGHHKTLNYKKAIEVVRENGADIIEIIVPRFSATDRRIKTNINRIDKIAICSGYINNVELEVKNDHDGNTSVSMKGNITRKTYKPPIVSEIYMRNCKLCKREIDIKNAYQHMLDFHPEIEDEINETTQEFMEKLKEWR